MKTYYDDGTLKIRSMNESDSKVLFDTYASYGWHPQLETQSCNTVAIAFYRAQGYKLIGYDTCCYTNRDIERKEVRFNFGYFFDKEK